MAERNRMPPWHERLRLRNGREVQIRPIRPEDAEPLRAGFALLLTAIGTSRNDCSRRVAVTTTSSIPEMPASCAPAVPLATARAANRIAFTSRAIRRFS